MDVITPETGLIAPKRKGPAKIIAICLAAVLIIGGVFVFLRTRTQTSAVTASQRTAFVVRGQLVDSITGSAPIVSSNRSELSPKVTATLQQIKCKEGDQVKKGDTLFVLDNTDALLDIENSRNSIAQMQLTLDSTAKSIGGLQVEAPYSGQVTNIAVKAGDSVNKGGALLTLTDVSKLNVLLPFSGSVVKNVQTGQKAVVHLPDIMVSTEGTITYKSSNPYSGSAGGEMYNIEITLDNPGSLKEGMAATGEITVNGTVLQSVETGKLAYVNKKVLKSDAGGTVADMTIRENEFVSKGDILVQLENDDLVLTSSTNDIKMENLRAQLEIQQKQLEYYTIKAPFDGTITSMGTANEGDTVKQGENLAVLSDMSHLEFSISIDELDISQIAVDQKVSITAEALEETQMVPFAGLVSKVAMEGTSNNGVTTYQVTVSVDDSAAGRLKTGMNIDAEIYISNKEDVLMIPLEAVVKMGNRSFVYVKGAQAQTQTQAQGATSGQFSQGGRSWSGSPDGMANGADNGTTAGTSNGNTGRRTRSRNTSGGAFGANAETTTGSAFRERTGTVGNTANTSPGAFRRGTGGMPQGGNADSYYDGAALIPVATGISNDTYIEIISGLTEGQEIVLPKTSKASSATTTNSFERNRNNGFMGGNIPGGGMQSGMTGGRPGDF